MRFRCKYVQIILIKSFCLIRNVFKYQEFLESFIISLLIKKRNPHFNLQKRAFQMYICSNKTIKIFQFNTKCLQISRVSSKLYFFSFNKKRNPHFKLQKRAFQIYICSNNTIKIVLFNTKCLQISRDSSNLYSFSFNNKT